MVPSKAEPYGNTTLRIMLPYMERCNTTNMYGEDAIDWNEMVNQYFDYYGDNDQIHEFIDSLVPCYYSEISKVYSEELGLDPIHIEIEESHVGMQIWQIMTYRIFNHYMTCFMDELEDTEEGFILSRPDSPN